MKYLFTKMRRDLSQMWSQFLSVFLMAFLGILIYVGTEGTWYGLKTELNSYFQKTNLASAWVYGNGITSKDTQKIKAAGNVTDCELGMTIAAKIKGIGSSSAKEPDIRLMSYEKGKISKPLTISGAEFTANGSGIWLDQDFANANSLKAGDAVVISVGDIQKTLTVKGLVMSSEYVYYTGSSTEATPNHKQHGYAFIGSGTAQDIFDETVVQKMQDQFLPELNKKINRAYQTARQKADSEVEKTFDSQISSQKTAAYLSAVKQADAKAEQVFQSTVKEKEGQAYTDAVLQADAKAEQAVTYQFKAAYPAVADFSTFAPYQTALASAKAQAEYQAKSAVDVRLSAQKAQLEERLAVIKAQAEQTAQKAVDQKFNAMQSDLNQKLVSAKTVAETKAKDAAAVEIRKTLNLTEEQFQALNKMISMPKMNYLSGAAKTATAKQFVDLIKTLPDSMLSQSINGFSLSTLKQTPIDYNIVRVVAANGSDTKVLEGRAQDILGDRYAGFADRDSLKFVSSPVQKAQQIEKMSIMFSIIFVLLALLTMQTTMTRLVDTQRTQIGTMKALGFQDSQIRFHYMSYGLTVGFLGGLLGLLTAPFTIAPALLHSQSAIYTLPEWAVRLTPVSYIMVGVVTLCCTLATFFACRKGLVGMPAETMRGQMPKTGRQVLLEKAPSIWKKVSFGWKWTLRDISRGKLRAAMGTVGVMGCMMLLMASLGMKYTDNGVPDYIYAKQYTYQSKAVLDSSATQSNRDELYKMVGGQWVEEASIEYKDSPSDETGMLSVLGNGNYVHLENSDCVSVSLPESGALVTQRTARILHLQRGDTVSFRLSGDKKYTAVFVADVIETPSPQGIFISESAWKKLGRPFAPTSLLYGSISSNDRISSYSYIQEVATRESQYVSTSNSLKTFNFIFMLLIVAAVMLDVVILYNLGILNFTERSREYATLKVLGFYQKEIRSFALRENLATTITGWLIGIPVGFWFLKQYVGAVSSSTIDMTPRLPAQDFLLATVITVGCSICVNLFLSRKVRKIDMIGALKSVE